MSLPGFRRISFSTAVYVRCIGLLASVLISDDHQTTNEARSWNWMHAVDSNSDRPAGSHFTKRARNRPKAADGVRQCQVDKINRPLFSLYRCPALWSRQAARRAEADGSSPRLSNSGCVLYIGL